MSFTAEEMQTAIDDVIAVCQEHGEGDIEAKLAAFGFDAVEVRAGIFARLRDYEGEEHPRAMFTQGYAEGLMVGEAIRRRQEFA